MKRRNVYHIRYQVNGIWDEVKYFDVVAESKADAKAKAIEKIIDQEDKHPFATYVDSVTYQNGNYRLLNN